MLLVIAVELLVGVVFGDVAVGGIPAGFYCCVAGADWLSILLLLDCGQEGALLETGRGTLVAEFGCLGTALSVLDFLCLLAYFGEFTDSLAVRPTVTDSDRQVQWGRDETTLGFLLTGFILGFLTSSEYGEEHFPDTEGHMRHLCVVGE